MKEFNQAKILPVLDAFQKIQISQTSFDWWNWTESDGNMTLICCQIFIKINTFNIFELCLCLFLSFGDHYSTSTYKENRKFMFNFDNKYFQCNFLMTIFYPVWNYFSIRTKNNPPFTILIYKNIFPFIPVFISPVMTFFLCHLRQNNLRYSRHWSIVGYLKEHATEFYKAQDYDC